MIYKGFEIVRSQPSRRVSWRIYKDGKYYGTSTLRKEAKSLIDWALSKGVWE